MKQALEMALEALELHGQQYPHMVKGYCLDAITAIKEALAQPEQHTLTSRVNDVRFHKERDEQRAEAMRMLAQPEQEPVAYIRVSKTGHVMACAKTGDFYSLPHKTLLYTTSPQRKPLTDEQMPAGWVFYTSDFSMRAAGKSVKGSVLLVRDEAGRKWWLGLEGNRDSDDFPPLYVGAEGETFEQAIANATDKARAIEAAHGIKE